MGVALKLFTMTFQRLGIGLLMSVLVGCQPSGIYKATNPNGKSLQNEDKLISKSARPKWAPYDWTQEDLNSREVWFYETVEINRCGSLIHSELWKPGFLSYTFLRNGNVQVAFLTDTMKLEEVFSIEAFPKQSLVSIAGINGLKPESEITLEFDDSFNKLEIRFSFYHYPDKKTLLAVCSLDGSSIQSLKKQRATFERARGLAVERLIENSTIAPVLVSKPPEKNGPVIAINDLPKVVDELNFIIRGEVSDESGVATLLIRNQSVKVSSDGRFIHRIKLGYGSNDILIAAEDINGNITEKVISITREEFISEETLADVDIPPRTRMSNPEALGVVIGVENYQYVPDATYAYNDAEVFREYLVETMGMDRQRVKLATNSKATQAEFSKLLGPNGWLARNIVQGQSDVVVYFSGHGIADADSTGLLPHDVDPNYALGLHTKQLYRDLANMGAKSVTVFLDACFTGQTRDSQMLIANTRPLRIKLVESEIPDSITVLAAATGSQISGALEEKEHGLFTYYVLKGLGGDADDNKDRTITLTELNRFVQVKVREKAAIGGREQTPESVGNRADRVLVQLQ